MTFNLTFPALSADVPTLQLEAGELLFVLGTNGTGKSALMFHFAQNNRKTTRKISAHRQTWMNSDALDMTPANKLATEQNIQTTDRQKQSRYRDQYAAQRASVTIYELINADNVRARGIAAFVDAGDMQAAAEASRKEAPITIINELLLQSNIPITISIRDNERVMASKNGGPEPIPVRDVRGEAPQGPQRARLRPQRGLSWGVPRQRGPALPRLRDHRPGRIRARGGGDHGPAGQGGRRPFEHARARRGIRAGRCGEPASRPVGAGDRGSPRCLLVLRDGLPAAANAQADRHQGLGVRSGGRHRSGGSRGERSRCG